jgi:hypothetical protein
MTNLPLYQSHKRVRALRIASIDYVSSTLHFGDSWPSIELQGAAAERITAAARGQPKLGYYVVYADGYESWSPTDAFEAGNTLITESPATPAVAEPNAQKIWNIARIVHEANRAYCEHLGDTSQPAWIDAPSWQIASALKAVEFRLQNPEASAEQQHQSWCMQKIADGWCWGLEKSATLKTHPCLVEYCDLPKEQQFKDALFATIVNAAR